MVEVVLIAMVVGGADGRPGSRAGGPARDGGGGFGSRFGRVDPNDEDDDDEVDGFDDDDDDDGVEDLAAWGVDDGCLPSFDFVDDVDDDLDDDDDDSL